MLIKLPSVLVHTLIIDYSYYTLYSYRLFEDPCCIDRPVKHDDGRADVQSTRVLYYIICVECVKRCRHDLKKMLIILFLPTQGRFLQAEAVH